MLILTVTFPSPCVALVALAPPVAIQIMGVLYVHRSKAVAQNKADLLSDDGVIDLEDEEI